MSRHDLLKECATANKWQGRAPSGGWHCRCLAPAATAPPSPLFQLHLRPCAGMYSAAAGFDCLEMQSWSHYATAEVRSAAPAPVPSAAFSMASASSAAASAGSFLQPPMASSEWHAIRRNDASMGFQAPDGQNCSFRVAAHLARMGMPPPWPPAPLNSTRIIAGAAMAVTTPMSFLCSSSTGPCSMCSSRKASMRCSGLCSVCSAYACGEARRCELECRQRALLCHHGQRCPAAPY